jgi:hypothetical protein
MRYLKYKEKLDNLKTEVIEYIRSYFPKDGYLFLKEHPEMDYPDVNGCRVIQIDSYGIYINPSDGDNYSLEVANIHDLLSIVSLLEGHNIGDWQFVFN